MLRPEEHAQGVYDDEGRGCHIQIEHICPETIVEIPESERALPDVVYDRVVVLQVLLDGVGTDVQAHKDPEFIAEYEPAVDEDRAHEQQEHDKERRLFFCGYIFFHKILLWMECPVGR